MMVLDVMVVVRIPCVSEKRIQQVGKEHVEQVISRRQNSVHMDVLMLHQRKSSTIPELEDPMQNAMSPREVVVQQKCAGYQGREIQNEMCQHDHISLEAYDALSPANVWLEYIFLHNRRQSCLKYRHVPGLEYGGIEVRM